MKTVEKLALALFAVLNAVPGVAATHESGGPEALAASFMAQMYEVNADEVEVTAVSKAPQSAVLLAAAPGGHKCRFEVAPAPADYKGQGRWLVGGLECDQRKQSVGAEQ